MKLDSYTSGLIMGGAIGSAMTACLIALLLHEPAPEPEPARTDVEAILGLNAGQCDAVEFGDREIQAMYERNCVPPELPK